MNVSSKLTIVMLGFLLMNCDYYDGRLEIVNQTQEEIVIVVSNDTLPTYPAVNKVQYYLSVTILPNDTTRPVKSGRSGWEFQIQRSTNRKLNLFVFNADSLTEYNSIDSLIFKRIYKRYSFSADELKERGWIVSITE